MALNGLFCADVPLRNYSHSHSVFRFLLNVDSDGDEVTEEGKLFHTRAATTGKVRSPTVERRVRGTVSASEEDEPRRRRVSRSATRWRSLAR